jgi:hypothetical protein
MEAIRFSETSVYTVSTRRHIPDDGILHNRRENLTSYTKKSVFFQRNIEFLLVSDDSKINGDYFSKYLNRLIFFMEKQCVPCDELQV